MSVRSGLSAGLYLTNNSFQTAANGVALLVFGRVVAGVSVGIASAIVPVYQSEIAPKEIRGRVVSLQQWAITWYVMILNPLTLKLYVHGF